LKIQISSNLNDQVAEVNSVICMGKAEVIKLLVLCWKRYQKIKKIADKLLAKYPDLQRKITTLKVKKRLLYSWTGNRVFLASVLVLLCISLAFAFFVADEEHKEGVPIYIDVEVRDGDTLWNIASRYASGKEDVREKVYIIKNINGIDQNVNIYAGQTIKVPVTNDLHY